MTVTISCMLEESSFVTFIAASSIERGVVDQKIISRLQLYLDQWEASVVRGRGWRGPVTRHVLLQWAAELRVINISTHCQHIHC